MSSKEELEVRRKSFIELIEQSNRDCIRIAIVVGELELLADKKIEDVRKQLEQSLSANCVARANLSEITSPEVMLEEMLTYNDKNSSTLKGIVESVEKFKEKNLPKTRTVKVMSPQEIAAAKAERRDAIKDAKAAMKTEKKYEKQARKEDMSKARAVSAKEKTKDDKPKLKERAKEFFLGNEK